MYVRKHKPHRHHVHKTVYLGGYVGGGGEVAAPETKTVYKTVQPIEKRVDVEAHGEAHGEAGAGFNGGVRKEVVVNARPSTFFQDIFNVSFKLIGFPNSLWVEQVKRLL